ncbi:MAG: hypothetical protein J0G96_03505 [Flavobacteriia bacterium]|nr:hypothetical protein [Flavobacteriia bacterium]OJX39290.1 MAG: hypothetical protein BGO87_04725 [Flavobacteriia bacterium 40-80]
MKLFLLITLLLPLSLFAQTKDAIIKDLSRYVDSLERELILIKREIADMKSSDPKLYDQTNLIEKQEKQIQQLSQENEKLKASLSRTEGQLKERSVQLDELKQKIKNAGADSLLSTIEITNFKALPQYAKNCACFFSRDQADYNNRTFLYIEDEKKDCLININGRQERLLYKGTDKFSNERYTLVFSNKKQIGTAGANQMIEALMTITGQKGEKISFSVMGVCGCE